MSILFKLSKVIQCSYLAKVHTDFYGRISLSLSYTSHSGCGHCAPYLLMLIKEKNGDSWALCIPHCNFNKANWLKHKMSDKLIIPSLISTSPDLSNKNIMWKILKFALVCIPWGQVKNHQSFWNAKILTLKVKQTKHAEKSKGPDYLKTALPDAITTPHFRRRSCKVNETSTINLSALLILRGME